MQEEGILELSRRQILVKDQEKLEFYLDALNLDGGGSTTLWLSGASDNGVVNYPCDNGRFDHAGERKVPNILYITHQ